MTREIIEKIKQGRVGVLPTDTIYGLCCSALLPKAVAKVYALKHKPAAFPLIILVADLKDLARFGLLPTKTESKLLKQIWPGPTSVIFELAGAAARKKWHYLHRGSNTLSFRLPADKRLRAFLKQTGPIIATSANVHNRDNAETLEQAVGYFGDNAEFYADGGTLAGKASTVVYLFENELFLLRQGEGKIPPSLPLRKAIYKKTWPDLFKAVLSGRKRFDLRVDDFEAQEGDLLVLQEFDPTTETYTGRSIRRKIGFILRFRPDEYPFAPAEEVSEHGLQIFSI